jgi:hypothetical protein
MEKIGTPVEYGDLFREHVSIEVVFEKINGVWQQTQKRVTPGLENVLGDVVNAEYPKLATDVNNQIQANNYRKYIAEIIRSADKKGIKVELSETLGDSTMSAKLVFSLKSEKSVAKKELGS